MIKRKLPTTGKKKWSEVEHASMRPSEVGTIHPKKPEVLRRRMVKKGEGVLI